MLRQSPHRGHHLVLVRVHDHHRPLGGEACSQRGGGDPLLCGVSRLEDDDETIDGRVEGISEAAVKLPH